MPASHRVIVLGLGIAGSSISATLARRGYSVTAIEQFSPLHDRGSSHGDTRIYRRVPHEGDAYVTMADASFAGWNEWNQLAGDQLFIPCGGVDAGPADSPMVAAAEELCMQHEQPFEIMSGASWNRRSGFYNLPSNWHVVYQPQSGVVRPDATRLFLHTLAREAGARLIHETRVLEIETSAAGVRVTTVDEGLKTEVVDAETLIVAAGSWLPALLPELNLHLKPERRVLAWHRPMKAENPALNWMDGRLPIFCFDADGGWYGMPTPDGRLKLGHDKHMRQSVDPAVGAAPPDAEDAALLEACVQKYFDGFEPKAVEMKSCIYTIAEDHHFILDRHPQHANVLIFSCCSGHGFKYAPAYGEIAADLVAGKTRPELEFFSLARGAARITRFG